MIEIYKRTESVFLRPFVLCSSENQRVIFRTLYPSSSTALISESSETFWESVRQA